jgi:hypothetical protein
VGKHSSNPQYFKGKKLQSEIFNQLNIKKIKLTKIILEKNKQKKGESRKKRKVILEKKRKNKQKKREKRGKLEKKSEKKD